MKIKMPATLIIAVIMMMIMGNVVFSANKTSSTNVKNNKTTSASNTVETQEKDQGLEKLEIEGVKSISPEFKTTQYDYQVKYIGDAQSLLITATPTEPHYVTKIIGNSDLKEGEDNLITILVSDVEGVNVATYQIKVDKSLIDEEEVARQQEELARERQKNVNIIIAGVAVTILILLILIFYKVRTRRKYDEYEEDDEEDDEES